MGLDFGTMNGGFQGDFGGFYSNSLSLCGSTLPGLPPNFAGTFGSELNAPSSFGYDLASNSYPGDDILPDFSFTNMLDLNSPWDFSGINLNAIELPVSEEHSTSPRKRAVQAIHNPTRAKASESTLPVLPMPQGTSKKTAMSQPPSTQPTPSAPAGPTPEPSLHGPQRRTVGSAPQKPINPGKAPLPPTQDTGLQEVVPQTQTPPTEPRVSKRVPIKSKRNEIANAIGTNNTVFPGANKAAGQQTPGRSTAKQTGESSSKGEKNYVHGFCSYLILTFVPRKTKTK